MAADFGLFGDRFRDDLAARKRKESLREFAEFLKRQRCRVAHRCDVAVDRVERRKAQTKYEDGITVFTRGTTGHANGHDRTRIERLG